MTSAVESDLLVKVDVRVPEVIITGDLPGQVIVEQPSNEPVVPNRSGLIITTAESTHVQSSAQGPAGAKGDMGGAGSYYAHTQNAAAALWTVTHGLSKRPAVTVLDTSGGEVHARVEHVSDQQVLIYFTLATSGTAHFS